MNCRTDHCHVVAGLVAMVLLAAPDGEARAAEADVELCAAVEAALAEERDVPSHRIDVECADGIVRLAGTSVTLLGSERASRVAGSVRGVRAVVADVAVRTPPREDSEIRAAVERALRLDPVADPERVEVAVRDGIVTLSGAVPSGFARLLAAALVSGIRGVAGVQNDLLIAGAPARSDAELAAAISRRLAWDVRVDDAEVSVEVRDGVAFLSGQVASVAEAQLAERLAWLPGIGAVDSRELAVRPERRAAMRRVTPASRSDAEVRIAVQDALRLDPRVAAPLPEVRANQGAVTLAGTVRSLRASRAAEQDARNTVGVETIRNRLRVRPDLWPSDRDIAVEIAAILADDALLDHHGIEPSVRDGRVRLAGRVDSAFERKRAEDLVSGVMGVSDVVNQVELHLPTPRGEALALAVRSRIERNPYLAGTRIHVEAEGAHVVLSGEVAVWRDAHTADVEARAAGAESVESRLEIRSGITPSPLGATSRDPGPPQP